MFFIDNNNFRNVNKKKVNEGMKVLRQNYGELVSSKVKDLIESGLKI